MTAAVVLEALVRANIITALAVALVLCLRQPVRALGGAGAAYWLWAAVPAAALASLLPERTLLAEVAGAPTDILSFTVFPQPSAPGFDLARLVVAVWLLGAVASFATLAVRQARLAQATGRLTFEPRRPDVAHAEHAGVGPAVIGVLAPKIVLPTDFSTRYSPEEQAVILAHETAHLRAGDTRINALIALLRCFAWFNPLVHVGAAYARLDQELARDADVSLRFPDARRCYAEAMLKSQLATVDLGCGWTPRTSQILKRRIAMLAKPNPSRIRRAAGAALALSASAFVGLAAWAAQPDAQSPEQTPRPVQQLERQGPQSPRPVERLQPEGQAPQPVQRLVQSEQAAPQPTPQPGSQPAQGEAERGESGEAVPVVRIPPTYPPEALAGDLTGRCILTFDLTEEGATRNVTAECSDAMFAAPATAAVERWRYEAGPARTGVQTVIAFELAVEEAPEPAE